MSFADDRRRQRELALPISVAQHHFRISIFSCIVGIGEQTSSSRFEAQQVEVVAADHASGNLQIRNFRNFTLPGDDLDVVIARCSTESRADGVPVAQFLM